MASVPISFVDGRAPGVRCNFSMQIIGHSVPMPQRLNSYLDIQHGSRAPESTLIYIYGQEARGAMMQHQGLGRSDDLLLPLYPMTRVVGLRFSILVYPVLNMNGVLCIKKQVP